MDKFELINKLMDKANISYEEARDILEQFNWDLLEAVVFLENRGDICKPSMDSNYKTREHFEDENTNKSSKNQDEGVMEFLLRWIEIGNINNLIVKKNKKLIFKLPLTVIVLLAVFIFWVVIPAFIIGLFFDVTYSLEGPSIKSEKVNDIFNKMSYGVNKFKKDIKKGYENDKNSDS